MAAGHRVLLVAARLLAFQTAMANTFWVSAQPCIPAAADRTLQSIRWRGVDDLSSLANQPVRFRFHLKNGKLYAFWVSPATSGASYGYVAAGGPGFSSNRDIGSSSGPN